MARLPVPMWYSRSGWSNSPNTIRHQLKSCGITLSWEGIRRALRGQDRVTVELKRADGATIHVRKSSRAEPRQRDIYDALGISSRPGNTEVTVIE